MRSLKLAIRTLLRTPFLTAVAVLTLGLGIGANAAIFSLFDQILLQSLPVAEPDRLVNLVAPGLKAGFQSCNEAGGCEEIFSYPLFRDLERAETGLVKLAAHRSFEANIAARERTLNGQGMVVSGSYFPLLGLRPALGRLLGPADDEVPGAHPVAVLGHAYWRTQLGEDPAVIGQTIIVNGHPLTIVGVAPPGFSGTTFGSRPDVYVPLTMREVLVPELGSLDNRRSHWAYVFGRLEPGVTLEQAAASLNAVYRAIINDLEAPLLADRMSGQALAQFRAKQLLLEPGRRGQSQAQEDARTPLRLLFAITGVVLLIACANIANLLLVRGANRSMEMALRLSLGARRRQVVLQLLTESCVLALLGGAAALLIAPWTLGLVAAILPPESMANLRLELRPSVVAFTAVLSLATGVLFGLFPAFHNTRTELVASIRSNTGTLTAARSAGRFRSGLVTVQVALAMALLVSAGLFMRSLVNISRADLGVASESVVTFAISPELSGYESARSLVLFDRVEEELASLPGVTGVSAARIALFAGDAWGGNVSVEGFEQNEGTDAEALQNAVGPDYFRTLGIALLAGREFTSADVDGAPRVAIVNEAFARKFGLGRDVVGKRMAIGRTNTLDIEIIGLVRDARYSEVKEPAPPMFFTPYRQDLFGALTFYVRTEGDPSQVLRAVPDVIARLDPNLPVEDLKTLPQQVHENVATDRMIGTLAAAFAALATLLAALGLYGVLAYAVAQRTREIGVRIALGADGRRVRGLVLRQVSGVLLVGAPIGIAAALGLGRLASSLLYGVGGSDPGVVAGATALLGAVALAAGYVPALRASRVDPVQALRSE